MIDYEKLKIAHELILKANEKYGLALYVGCSFNSYFRIYSLNSDYFEDYVDIDELISKLTELTTPKYKHKIGDWIWCYSYENIPDRVQVEFHPEGNKNTYQVRHENGMTGFYEEERLYPSFDALVEAQIEYWIGLRDKNCTHAHVEYVSSDYPISGEITVCKWCSKVIRRVSKWII